MPTCRNGHRVDTPNASFCPICGVPLSHEVTAGGKRSRSWGWAAVVAVLVFLVWVAGCGTSHRAATQPQATPPRASTVLAVQDETPTPSPSYSPTRTPTSTRTPTLLPTIDLLTCELGALYIRDVTIPDGSRLATGSAFVKTWEISNTGTCTWTTGFRLVHMGGDILGAPDDVALPYTPPGFSAEVSVPMEVPTVTGQHQGQWRICVGVTDCFGTEVYVDIIAVPPPSRTPIPTWTPRPTAIPKKADLEVLDHESETESWSRYIVGRIRNNTRREYSYVQVEINLYDDSGAQVGSTMDNTTNLEPGGIWKFKALIWEDNATKYKIKNVTGF